MPSRNPAGSALGIQPPGMDTALLWPISFPVFNKVTAYAAYNFTHLESMFRTCCACIPVPSTYDIAIEVSAFGRWDSRGFSNHPRNFVLVLSGWKQPSYMDF